MHNQIAPNTSEYRDVPVAALIESPSNPRKRFDETSLGELAASFESQGVLAPLLVRNSIKASSRSLPERDGFGQSHSRDVGYCHTRRMCDRLPNVERIVAQIASLNTQEQDALQLVLRKPNVSGQVSGVLRRIRTDREHLTAVLREAVATGRSVMSWSDLVAEHRAG